MEQASENEADEPTEDDDGGDGQSEAEALGYPEQPIIEEKEGGFDGSAGGEVDDKVR